MYRPVGEVQELTLDDIQPSHQHQVDTSRQAEIRQHLPHPPQITVRPATCGRAWPGPFDLQLTMWHTPFLGPYVRVAGVQRTDRPGPRVRAFLAAHNVAFTPGRSPAWTICWTCWLPSARCGGEAQHERRQPQRAEGNQHVQQSVHAGDRPGVNATLWAARKARTRGPGRSVR